MMRKYTYVLMMCGALLVGLASCGGGGKSKNADSTDTSAQKNNSTSSNTSNESEQSSESSGNSNSSVSASKEAQVIQSYCDKLNSYAYMEIKSLFANNVTQYIGMKNTTNEALAKEIKRFLPTKSFIDYHAEVDQLKVNGKTARVPMNINWEGYQARVLTEIEFDDNYKIVSYKEVKRLPLARKIKTEKRQVVKTYQNCNYKSKKGDCPYMSFDYVKVTQAPSVELQEKMNKKIISLLSIGTGEELKTEADVTKAANNFVQSFAEAVKSHSANSTWYTKSDLSVRENNGIASVIYSSEGYGGGAHGFSSIATAHFDTNTGKELTLNDIMVPNYLPEMKKIATKVFRKLNEIEDGKTISDHGYSMNDNEKFVLAKNFLLEGDHIEFMYNRYEAGPYYLAPPMVRLKYKDIKHLIKKDGPLGHKVK
ncbi:RsiV family protein [uncultured Microscilla sp.]|uniref:RsiV family protein n=1 Tax=uncultured Microscilla sp. TaxID=432653 RepID=UPI002629D381|nr:RsiV family protein [uncultured Microscilla sp.]